MVLADTVATTFWATKIVRIKEGSFYWECRGASAKLEKDLNMMGWPNILKEYSLNLGCETLGYSGGCQGFRGGTELGVD